MSLPENVRRTLLPNGVVVLSEHMPGQRSVSVGVWLGIGSRHDPVGKAGLAHMYEHMVFKGTTKRTPMRISRELEAVGGHLNAFTSREQTCFYAKILDCDLPRAIDLLCDLVADPKLSGRDMAKERLVVLEEIRACDDDPEELVGDLFAQALWARHPLGEPIAGTLQSAGRLTEADLHAHRERILGDEVPVLVTAAGNIDHDRLVDLVARGLEAKQAGAPRTQPVPRTGKTVRHRLFERKDVSQVNLILARRGLSAVHPDRHALALVNLVLGGGMASRLNQELRERRGLAYSVYSFTDFLLGTGAVGISLGTEPKQSVRAVELVAKEVEKIHDFGLTRKDLQFARNYAKGAAVLGLESPSARMQHHGKCLLLYGRPIALDEIIENIESVTAEQVEQVCRTHFPALEADTGWIAAGVVPQDFKGDILP